MTELTALIKQINQNLLIKAFPKLKRNAPLTFNEWAVYIRKSNLTLKPLSK